MTILPPIKQALYHRWRSLRGSGLLCPEWEASFTPFLEYNQFLFQPKLVPRKILTEQPLGPGNIIWLRRQPLRRYPTGAICLAYRNGYSQRQIANLFHLSQTTVLRILREYNHAEEA